MLGYLLSWFSSPFGGYRRLSLPISAYLNINVDSEKSHGLLCVSDAWAESTTFTLPVLRGGIER